MRALVVSTAMFVAMFVSGLSAQRPCLQPKWLECVSFPNGGRHTGTDFYDKALEIAIPPNSEICVRNEWEIRAESYVQFSRNGEPRPHRDWEVRIENFCLYRN
jgi:hypothetical protein